MDRPSTAENLKALYRDWRNFMSSGVYRLRPCARCGGKPHYALLPAPDPVRYGMQAGPDEQGNCCGSCGLTVACDGGGAASRAAAWNAFHDNLEASKNGQC